MGYDDVDEAQVAAEHRFWAETVHAVPEPKPQAAGDPPPTDWPEDTATAALVGACDGTLPVGVLLTAVADLLDNDPATLAERVLPAINELVTEGFLSP